MDFKRLKYAVFPFLLIIFLLFITYFGNQWYAETFGNPGKDYSHIFMGINQAVPFLNWTIYPYVLAYPVWFLGIFVVAYHSKRNFYNMVSLVIIAFIILGLWYFLFQSDVTNWRLTSGLFLNDNYLTPRTDLNFTDHLVMLIYMSAGPRNALPSMHTVNSWICIIGVRADKKISKTIVILTWIFNLSIIIATQTTKQHYIIDLIVGVILAEIIYWLVKDSKFSLWVEKIFSRLNSKYGMDWDETIK